MGNSTQNLERVESLDFSKVKNFVSSFISLRNKYKRQTIMDKNQEESYLKSLVGDYLTSVSPNLAKKFKNGNKVKPLPAGSPTLLELVKEHQKNSPIKRKLNMSNGHTPAKKAKKDESSSDEESDEDSEDSGLQVKAPAKPAAEPMEEDSSSDDSESEEEEKAKPAAKPADKKAPAKKE